VKRLLAACAVAALAAPLQAQSRASAPGGLVSDGEVHILPIRDNIYMLVGAGGNITVQTGDEGILLVDTGTAAMSAKTLAAVRTLSNKPIRYIINTGDGDDHTGGNERIGKAGAIIPFGNLANVQARFSAEGASIISQLNVLTRMSTPTGKTATTPEAAWPNNTYSTPQKKLYFNDEPIMIMHQPANTDGNSIVLFRKADIISAGDLVDLTGYPRIDVKSGGSIQEIVTGLNRLIDTTIPSGHAEGGTLVIPGRGRLCDQGDVVVYQQMVTIVRDRIQDMVKRGMTLDQVKAAKPTADYDVRYGRMTGPWTTDMFVEASYQSLKK
jgi:glyoxylase-like metal-dependent hydrolase (beta-lactamase superfamily II)